METGLLFLVHLGCFVLAVWALVDCITRRKDAFVAAEKLTKPLWLAITVVATLVGGFSGSGLPGILLIASLIASSVYLVDVRPAVREISSGGNSW